MTAAGPAFTVRRATPADVATIVAHRIAMFHDMGRFPRGDGGVAAEALARATADYLAGSVADGTYAGWLAVDADGGVVGGAGVLLRADVPRQGVDGRVLTGPQALLLNVYTVPAWRRRGIAAVLVRTAVDWADARGCSAVVLHASDAGRLLYERLGLRPTNEMQYHGAPVPLAGRRGPPSPHP